MAEAKQPIGIACPKCNSTESEVARTRHQSGYVWRRRRCKSCGSKFTTTERAAGSHNATDAPYVALTDASIAQLVQNLGIRVNESITIETDHSKTK